MARTVPRTGPAAVVLVLAVLLISAEPPPTDVVAALERAVQKAVARAEPAIACILVSRRFPPPTPFELGSPDYVPEYYGSGVVIDHRLILTNYHVVRDATSIFVRLPPLAEDTPPRASEARIHAADLRSDLAVLKLTSYTLDTPAIELGRGEDLRKGSFVISLANPYAAGFRDGQPAAGWGIVSNLRRRASVSPREEDRLKTFQHVGTLVQTDARLPLGCSGGALLDMQGRLIGLTSAQSALTGVEADGGFALPMDDGIRRVVEVLRRGEEVEYGFLGVSTSRLMNRRGSGGVVLDGVTANSPADRAGLRPGDTIVSFNGQPIRDFDDLFHYVGLGLAGREATVEVVRPGLGRRFQVVVLLGKFYQAEFGEATNRPPAVHGLRVDHASVVARGGNQSMPDGVVVREVEKGSPAEKANLAEYADIIVAVNGKPVRTPAEFYRECETATRAGQPIRLNLTNPPRLVTLP